MTLREKRAAVKAAARVRVAVYGSDDTFYASLTKAEALRLLDAAVTQLGVALVDDTAYIEKD